MLDRALILSAEEEINNMKIELEKYGIQMPAFSKIGGILANELSVDEAARKEREHWGSPGVVNVILKLLDIRNCASEFKSVDLVLNTATVYSFMGLLFGNK